MQYGISIHLEIYYSEKVINNHQKRQTTRRYPVFYDSNTKFNRIHNESSISRLCPGISRS